MSSTPVELESIKNPIYASNSLTLHVQLIFSMLTNSKIKLQILSTSGSLYTAKKKKKKIPLDFYENKGLSMKHAKEYCNTHTSIF